MSLSPLGDDVQLLHQFRLGLQSGAVRPHYQPEVDFDRPRWMGLEALSRWHDPAMGDISPGRFIPLAEKHGVLADLTTAQIEHLAHDAPALTQRFEQVSLAFNLSPTLIGHAGVRHALLRAVDACSALPLSWEVEITESEAIADFGPTRRQLHDLRERGIKVVLDDFGTGWSNWARTELLPVDRIKIDSAFVRGLTSQAARRTLSEIRNRALSKGIELTVEGVETAAQEAILRELGFSRFQGWLYAQAMPLQALLSSGSFFKSRL